MPRSLDRRIGNYQYAWLRWDLWKRTDGKCSYCLGEISEWECELDHVVPTVWDRVDEPWNLWPCCRSCNRSKGSRMARHWISSTLKRRLLKSGNNADWVEQWCAHVRSCAVLVEETYMQTFNSDMNEWIETPFAETIRWKRET